MKPFDRSAPRCNMAAHGGAAAPPTATILFPMLEKAVVSIDLLHNYFVV